MFKFTLKYIIFILLLGLMFSFNSYAGFSDFAKGNSGVSTENKKSIGLFGNTSNTLSGSMNLGDASASMGVKADCNNISFDFNFSAFLDDIGKQLKEVITAYGYIKGINMIIYSLAYLESAYTCKDLLPQELGASFVTTELASRITKSVQEDISDAFKSGTGGVGGTASFAEKDVELKPTKVAQAMNKASSEVAKQAGEVFLACLDKHIPEYEKKITQFLNFSINLGFEKYFKLRQECMLKSEQSEMDIVQMFNNYSKTGEVIFADAVRIRSDGKIETLGKRMSLPTKEQEESILKVAGSDFVNWAISSNKDPLLTTLVAYQLIFILDHFDSIADTGIGEYVSQVICGDLYNYITRYSQHLTKLKNIDISSLTAKDYNKKLSDTFSSLLEELKNSNTDVFTFTEDEVLEFILSSYKNYGSYREIIKNSILLYLYEQDKTTSSATLTIEQINDILKNVEDIKKYISAGYILYILQESGVTQGKYLLNTYFNEHFHKAIVKMINTYLGLRKAVEATRQSNPETEITLTKVTKLIQENAIQMTDLQRENEYKGIFGIINLKCKALK
jgi:hypothetical protein